MLNFSPNVANKQDIIDSKLDKGKGVWATPRQKCVVFVDD